MFNINNQQLKHLAQIISPRRIQPNSIHCILMTQNVSLEFDNNNWSKADILAMGP